MADHNDELDGAVAAPEHHHVLFENDRVRVLETTIPPGDTTPVHTHPACVMYILSGTHFVRRDPRGQVMVDTRSADPPYEMPRVLWSDGTPAHTLENTGEEDLALIAVEPK